MTLVGSDDDLDWEFAFDSHLGLPTGSSEEPLAKSSKKWCAELPILHPDAAGIDVGASDLFVYRPRRQAFSHHERYDEHLGPGARRVLPCRSSVCGSALRKWEHAALFGGNGALQPTSN
jgi:hypothetical protein